MSEETSVSFRSEGQPAFPVGNEGTGNPPAEEAGKPDVEQTQSQEGEQNSGAQKDGDEDKEQKPSFRDDPRWAEREEDWKHRFNEQEERHIKEVATIIEKFGKSYTPPAKAEQNELPPIPSWFGGDESQWKEFVEWNQGLVAKTEASVRASFEQKTQAEQQAIDEATEYFNDQVGAIESDRSLNPTGAKIDRNKILKIALDNDLVDSQGRWNWKVAFMMMQSKPQADNKNLDEKKKIAGATTSENRGESKPSQFMTSDDFKKPGARPW